MTSPAIIQVALPVPRGEVYDYLCTAPVEIGMRVRVPFGRRDLIGIVVACAVESSLPAKQLKAVRQLVDTHPLVTPDWLALLRFAASYYQAPLGFAIATALPSSLRKGKLAEIQRQPRWRLSEAGRSLALKTLDRAPRQRGIIQALRESDTPLSASQLGDGVHSALKALAGKGLIEAMTASPARVESQHPVLNPEQAAVVEAIRQEQGFACHLLEGVTGSGKTEVYLALAREQVAQGRQCLILVPEIGLTPQMVDRVRAGTGARVLSLHSGLAEGERHNAWLHARNGEVDILLGTRSAVFAALPRPGLIVVDEEHDSSYKQQDGMRYNARDLAVRRAQQAGIPVVLGSATPSLESHYNAQQGRYRRHHIHKRHGAARHPRLRIIDLRGQNCRDGLSNALIQAIRQHLEAEKQVLLFINRRGYAPVLLCHDCGWTATCNRCDARLITHRRSRSLRCHHCGHQRPLPASCPDCQSSEIQHLGQGTERIENAVAALWPEVPRLRFDRDVLQRRGELEQALSRIASGEIRLIIGTQMLAKGHDFPRLSLVGIIDADQGLYGQDFRAAEQLAQQVTQVAGRAGRRDTPGEVLLQTHNPDHALLQALQPGNYTRLADSLLAERQMLHWPPYTRLALLRVESNQADHALNTLQELAELFVSSPGLDVLGPAPALMERKGGQFRFQLLLRSTQRQLLQRELLRLRAELEQRPQARRLRWSLDVDPQFLD